jgi:hypothetical protein
MADSQLIQWQAAIIEARARGMARSAVAEEYGHRYPSNASGVPVVLEVARRYPRALVSSTGASLFFFFLVYVVRAEGARLRAPILPVLAVPAAARPPEGGDRQGPTAFESAVVRSDQSGPTT